MIITQPITMDLINPGNIPQINAVQGDSFTRKVAISLHANGVAWYPQDCTSAAIRYLKPDGTGGIYDTLPDGTVAWELQDNVITIALAPQVLAVPGYVTAQVEMVASSKVLATFSFKIIVAKDPSVDVMESEPYVNWHQWSASQLEALLAEARDSGEFDGAPGVTPNLQIGTVTTLPAGSSATASIRGTIEEPLLDLGIPQSPNTGIQSADHPGCYYRTVDGATEWVNPPMVAGVEYRTTERYMGKPVYIKLVDCGNLPANGGKTVALDVEDLSAVADLKGVISTNVGAHIFPYIDDSGNALATARVVYSSSAGGFVIAVYTHDDLSANTAIFMFKYIKNY